MRAKKFELEAGLNSKRFDAELELKWVEQEQAMLFPREAVEH
jgi:hypothetical protein